MIGLLQVQEADNLPIPIGLSWNGCRGCLEVQVREADYRAWMEAIATPVLESKPYHGTTHLYASGELRRCRMVTVHVVAVTRQVGELPEVGAP
jgi:hypothetical protein